MRIVIVDNYDSFTYNLSHLLRRLGADVSVVRNDRFDLPSLEAFDKIVLSPGPGVPSEAGQTPAVLAAYAGRKPILGVCLGHQAIGEHFGARLENLAEVFHGVQTPMRVVAADYLFEGLPAEFPVGRYHSWVVSGESLPQSLEVLAVSPDGAIMALRHRRIDIRGVQFHPESVLTPSGEKLLSNWLLH